VSKPLDLSRLAPTVVLVASGALVLALAALLGRVGADARWLAALGHVIASQHTIPDGVPFAAAPTAHWPNALVLAELIFNALERVMGDRGLMLAQLLAVAGALAVIARDARVEGAKPVGVGAALLVAGLGALPSLAIVRAQLFSLVLFPVLVALLRAQTRSPSRAIWWVVPLLALWSNLHGAALLGLGLVLAYLVLQRGRRQPLLGVGVAGASLLALCLTPALLRTPAYYEGLLTNLAAQRGDGMWGPLSLNSPLDLVLLGAALLLGVRMWRARPALWEWVVIAVLALVTVRAQRDGVWLLFMLVAPAARVMHPERSMRALAPVAAVASVAGLALALAHGPAPSGASSRLVTGAVTLAHGSPVLADGAIDEQVALAGGRIWAGNPIDAFSRPVQAAYLDWLNGAAAGRYALTSAVNVVLVSRGTATQTLMSRMPGFVQARTDGVAIMYERAAGRSS
jgi:X-X-X-Leu-X-X-Gly heptad repeat protein